MIQCPACRKDVPDWTQNCQFCGADTKKVARATPVAKGTSTYAGYIAPWIWSAYYAIAAYFIISGVGSIAQTIQTSHTKFLGQEMGLSVFSYVAMAIGAATALVGMGLIFKIEIARGIANFLCGLNIIFGLFSLAGALFGTIFSGLLGILLIAHLVVDLAANGLMIYIIGETDRGTKFRGSSV